MDEDDLRMMAGTGTNAVKKEKEFWNRVRKDHCGSYKKKKEFDEVKNDLKRQMLHDKLPI